MEIELRSPRQQRVASFVCVALLPTEGDGWEGAFGRRTPIRTHFLMRRRSGVFFLFLIVVYREPVDAVLSIVMTSRGPFLPAAITDSDLG